MKLILIGTKVEQIWVNAFGSWIFFVNKIKIGNFLIGQFTVRNNMGGNSYAKFRGFPLRPKHQLKSPTPKLSYLITETNIRFVPNKKCPHPEKDEGILFNSS